MELTLDRCIRMNLNALFSVFAEVKTLYGHSDYVVIVDHSILGIEESFEILNAMKMSIDIDCYTKADPGRIFDLVRTLGENSGCHHRSSFISMQSCRSCLAFPMVGRSDSARWSARVCAWFLEPTDSALSKYARGKPRDRRWIKAGILAGVVSMPVVKSRLGSTNFIDHDEELKARKLVEEDRLWFAVIQDQRKPTV